MEATVFFISAAIVLAGAGGVILARNPVHAALSLVMTLFGVAVLFINMEAYFLAAVQVIVYAGAIVVLFLFVIMLVGVDKAEDIRTEPIIGQRQFALLAGAAMLALVAVVGVAFAGETTGTAAGPQFPIERPIENADGVIETVEPNVRQLARVLFTDYVFAFEITAILLTIAVVGAVVLARRPEGDLQPIPDVDPSWALRKTPEDGRGDAAAGDAELASAEDGRGDAAAGDTELASAEGGGGSDSPADGAVGSAQGGGSIEASS